MNVYTVSLFGHRTVENSLAVEKRLETVICDLLATKEYVTFLVGRDGAFDLLAASVVHRCQRIYRNDNSSLVWVMPYLTAKYRENQEAFLNYYDEIEICESRHYKTAFQVRNRSMVDRSDLVVCFVSKRSGGSYNAMQYGRKRKRPIINLAYTDRIEYDSINANQGLKAPKSRCHSEPVRTLAWESPG